MSANTSVHLLISHAKIDRFFFADERKADGSDAGSKPSAEGHAKIYLQLTEDDSLPTYVTFVDGKYHEFP